MRALVSTKDVTGQGLTDLQLMTLEKHGLSVSSSWKMLKFINDKARGPCIQMIEVDLYCFYHSP